ncbi:MAG: hypothetical protein A3D13_05335 [Planctomycetes bacterium RIFCSPHIGHO2_02_FULL_40_12]|nr:MAG: hypothetical protein A3D13_05335 [Planctomycetes bacterium RIFCSPHIGHO2_02_FULL_40_12]OHC04540.1 MAG: hypothetical protein A3H23_03075 [Planctomycetes bacterium RIFCSPLOWO2_12_FULL_40_19]
MKQLLIALIVMCVMFTGPVSCKKTEEVAVEVTHTSEKKDETLGQAMKSASRDLRRLSRSIKNRDWVEIEMWAKELKEGIGYSCVELYMKEHRGISSEFVIMGSRFFDAVRNLILLCKEHDVETIDVEFNRLLTTCDDCHEIYKEKEELPLTLQSDL